jgi:hypothetical protein
MIREKKIYLQSEENIIIAKGKIFWDCGDWVLVFGRW